jgi:hypothetical protein
MSNLYGGSSKDESFQISIHLAKRLQRRRIFRNQPNFDSFGKAITEEKNF